MQCFFNCYHHFQKFLKNELKKKNFMCFSSVLFSLASPKCFVSLVPSTTEFGDVQYITGSNDCFNSDLQNFSSKTAYFPSSETVINNTFLSYFETMIFEGTIQSIGDTVKNSKRVIFCNNVANFDQMLPFHINNHVRIDFYGSAEPTYNYSNFSSTYTNNIEIHVSSKYGSNSFLGLKVTQDLTSAPYIEVPTLSGNGRHQSRSGCTLSLITLPEWGEALQITGYTNAHHLTDLINIDLLV